MVGLKSKLRFVKKKTWLQFSNIIIPSFFLIVLQRFNKKNEL